MRLFTCQACGNVLYFENTRCEACGHALGYLPAEQTITALQSDGDGFAPLAAPGTTARLCDNARYDVCNWLVADAAEPLCLACRHNRTIPDVDVTENRNRWRLIEWAKHRLFYTLLKLDLPTPTRAQDPRAGLAFDFLAEPPQPGAAQVMTGHADGLITLSLKEADDAERTTLREAMGEPYRTLLGHFRHEIGHYYWDRLVRDGGRLDDCRAVFGDDRADYQAALQHHYQQGAPPDWQERFISAYASTHPWEDFAETWAHYLHIVDTLDTAAAFGLRVRPAVAHPAELDTSLDLDPYDAADARTLVQAWLPLTYAVNSLNRSMGQPDLYPFILSAPVVDRLEFIHRLIHRI